MALFKGSFQPQFFFSVRFLLILLWKKIGKYVHLNVFNGYSNKYERIKQEKQHKNQHQNWRKINKGTKMNEWSGIITNCKSIQLYYRQYKSNTLFNICSIYPFVHKKKKKMQRMTANQINGWEIFEFVAFNCSQIEFLLLLTKRMYILNNCSEWLCKATDFGSLCYQIFSSIYLFVSTFDFCAHQKLKSIQKSLETNS